jgi:hypothetical protein
VRTDDETRYNRFEPSDDARNPKGFSMNDLHLEKHEYVYLAVFATLLCIAFGAWGGYISHSQHMSLVRSLNAERIVR